jgi:hypothetical protein
MSKFIWAITVFSTLFALSLIESSSLRAADTMIPVSSMPAGSPNGRSKDIQFDDSVVEGMNKSGKDSLEMVSKNEDPNRTHLYHKRADFKPELKQLSSEVGSE